MQLFQQKNNIMEAIRNIAMYIRKSRGELEKDLEKHKLVMKEICENNNWNYVEYFEIGSGESIEDRVKIKELLSDVEEGLFDAVFVFDFDRLGRGNGADQERIQRVLKYSDTLVVTANPFEVLDPNDERDEETMDFKGFMARREYKMINKRLSTGRKIGQRMGNWSNGAAPYGYKYNPELKKLVPDEKESEIYKELIVKEFMNGKSTYDIAWNLNKKKLPSPRNKQWTPETVNRLLKSEVHLGYIVFNKTEGVHQSKNKSGNKKPLRFKPREEWITKKNCHTPLKTDQEHMRILHILKQRKTHSKGGNINSLSGIVKCINCSSTLTIQKDDKEDVFLKKCSNCGEIKGGELRLVEDAIYITAQILSERLSQMNVQDSSDKEKEIILQKINKLENEIEKNEEALERIEDAYEEGLYSADKAKKKTRIRQEAILTMEDEMKIEMKKMENFSLITNEQMLEKIDKFLNDIKEKKNGRELNAIYKSIISHVTWERRETDEVRVTVNFL